MTYIKDIINFTETFAPLDTAMDFDNFGLLVGGKDSAVTKAIVALDITDSVINEAVELGAELVISHHPVIFNPIKSVDNNSAIYKLAQNNLSALCLHTNLDLSPEFGVNTCLAEAVGVKNGMFAEGECLLIGELEKEQTPEEFALNVKKALNCNGLRYTAVKDKIKTVAICSGSGGDYAPLAKEYNADVLLTGEIRHHEILLANALGISVVDAGHFKTEDIVIAPLCQKLNEKFPDVEFIKSKTCTDGIEYC
jgi:dinuclear metal center YbgI/SA1388 family protein